MPIALLHAARWLLYGFQSYLGLNRFAVAQQGDVYGVADTVFLEGEK